LPFLVLMLSYPFYPPLLAWADLPFPAWLRWCGAGLALATVPFLVWIHRALGRNFSTTIRVRADHTLVTWGPDRWVRHPMYTLFGVLFAAFFLLTANWFLGLVPLLLVVVVMGWRTPREEAVLLARFGNAYSDYCRRTGRFLPRLREGTT